MNNLQELKLEEVGEINGGGMIGAVGWWGGFSAGWRIGLGIGATAGIAAGIMA